ncbi:hypothetical protein Zm00014a_038377 [Zea mays]|uniref:Secreted protein n=1 Tax=Zea mays TaxID=4577 RepID=A0A3L6EB33_MAIZE|nr:hypothetical protein Zm00014a_038377 [Zea mays]
MSPAAACLPPSLAPATLLATGCSCVLCLLLSCCSCEAATLLAASRPSSSVSSPPRPRVHEAG